MALLRLESVTKVYRQRTGPGVLAVDGVSLELNEGETLGLIGESGSGKSTVARLALGLLKPDAGRVEFDGLTLSELKDRQLRQVRASLGVVFQEPFESLNPRMRVHQIVAEPLAIHKKDWSRAEREQRVLETLEDVRLDPSRYAWAYPHDLSGGQQQRVGIARALVTRPKVIVLDEPTSSLDVSVRAQILSLLAELQKQFTLSYLFVSHDILTVEYMCERLAIMYRGQVVETGPTGQVFANAQHPYTRALLTSRLDPDPEVTLRRYRLHNDDSGGYRAGGPGCRLVERCPIQIERCRTELVGLDAFVDAEHRAACLRAPTPFWAGHEDVEEAPA